MAVILLSLLLWQPSTDTVEVKPLAVAGVPGVWLPRPAAEYYFDQASRVVPLQRVAILQLTAAYDSARVAIEARRIEAVMLRRQIVDVGFLVELARESARLESSRADNFARAYRKERRRGRFMAAGSGTLIVGALVLAVVL